MQKILILGGSGTIGHRLFQSLAGRFEPFATFRDTNGWWRHVPFYAECDPSQLIGGVDAGDFDNVARAIDAVRPAVAINCIGIVKQSPDADDPLSMIETNSLLPHRLAHHCAAAGTRLIQLSTDCVFSGCTGGYREQDPSDAEDLYGRTKALGEIDRPGCLTLRTSFIGRSLRGGEGLLEWFLAQQGRRIRGYRNAIYSGLSTAALAQLIGDVITDHPDLSGLFHVAGAPISKYDLLVALRQAMQLDIEIAPYDEPHCDRSLDATRFFARTGYPVPDWDAMVAQLAGDLSPYAEWRRCHAIA